LKDIYTVEDLANVKAVVPGSVKKNGWAILNAADELTYKMKDKVDCNVALFSSEKENVYLQEHIKNGGSAVYADKYLDVYIFNGTDHLFVFNVKEVPVTHEGKAEFMTENLLPVVLAAYFSDIPIAIISDALTTFVPSVEHTPGRINEFKINGLNVIVDYAHNPHGLRALAGFLKHLPEKKTGIITVPGDRRDTDIIEFGEIAAATYDQIIIRFDRDTRGRTEESIVELLGHGIHNVKPGFKYHVIGNTRKAIEFAIETAEKGSYVIICAEDAIETIMTTKSVAESYK